MPTTVTLALLRRAAVRAPARAARTLPHPSPDGRLQLPLMVLARQLSTTRAISRPPPSASTASRPSSTSQKPAVLYGPCPTCHAPFASPLPICSACGSIHTLPADINYFRLFSLPEEPSSGAFDVDVKELRTQFLKLQRACHPDAWSSKGEVERRRAEEMSSVLNSAYKTLRSPLLRAEYILTMNGHPPLETDSLDETSSELLLDVLETRQEIESATDSEDLEHIRERNSEYVDRTLQELDEAFYKLDWERLKKLVVELRYWMGIEDAAVARMGEVDD